MEIASLSYQALVHSTDTSPWIRMSKIGRAPTLPNEHKYGRWDPSVLDGSSHSADPRKKVNNKRIVKWKETINIIISISHYALCDWSILQAASHCMDCYASFLSFPVPLINLLDHKPTGRNSVSNLQHRP